MPSLTKRADATEERQISLCAAVRANSLYLLISVNYNLKHFYCNWVNGRVPTLARSEIYPGTVGNI